MPTSVCETRWQSNATSGRAARQAPDGWRTYLLHARPGQGLLEHGHKGCEMTAVISGAFRDDTGLYRAGDFIECGMDLEHRPKVEGEAACLGFAGGFADGLGGLWIFLEIVALARA